VLQLRETLSPHTLIWALRLGPTGGAFPLDPTGGLLFPRLLSPRPLKFRPSGKKLSNAALSKVDAYASLANVKKIKASHTHYRADPGVQAVSLQVTVSHPPGSRLPLLSARHAVTFPAAEHHCRLAGTKLYCLVTEAHRCEQLAPRLLRSFCPE